MSQEKRIPALAHMVLAMSIGMALAACSSDTYSATRVQAPDSATRPSQTADSGLALPEIVVTATRLPPPRVAEQTSSRPPAKRRG
jgi:hypothetical protein